MSQPQTLLWRCSCQVSGGKQTHTAMAALAGASMEAAKIAPRWKSRQGMTSEGELNLKVYFHYLILSTHISLSERPSLVTPVEIPHQATVFHGNLYKRSCDGKQYTVPAPTRPHGALLPVPGDRQERNSGHRNKGRVPWSGHCHEGNKINKGKEGNWR